MGLPEAGSECRDIAAFEPVVFRGDKSAELFRLLTRVSVDGERIHSIHIDKFSRDEVSLTFYYSPLK